MRPAIRHMLGLSAPVMLLLLTGCATSQLVPSELEGRLSRDVSFQALLNDPETFRGRWVVLGGKVLSAKRLKDETELEILELPLDYADRPVPRLSRSRGRFLAVQRDFLDPATVPPGTLVSLIGEVIGAKTRPLDEMSYTYPVLQIKTLKPWTEPSREYLIPGPYPYPYWRGPYPYWRDPFWGPYPYPYPYWWP